MAETFEEAHVLWKDGSTSDNAETEYPRETLFVDSAGGDGDPVTVDDNDWSLAVSYPEIIGMGLDASVPAYDKTTTDFAGTARTCPTPVGNCTSPGAYERDP